MGERLLTRTSGFLRQPGTKSVKITAKVETWMQVQKLIQNLGGRKRKWNSKTLMNRFLVAICWLSTIWKKNACKSDTVTNIATDENWLDSYTFQGRM